MTKEARITKLEGGFGTPNDVSSFGLRHSFVIRQVFMDTATFVISQPTTTDGYKQK